MDLQSFEEFCEKLKIDAMDGNRALSRRHVSSAQAGKDGPWWIEPASCKKYILAGAPDLRRPADATAAGFDDGALRATGNGWAGKVRDAITELIPAEPPAPGANEVRIAPTSGNIPKLTAARTPATAITPYEVRRVVRWADCYLIPALRQHVSNILRQTKGEPHGMARLYDPRYYNEITTEAMSRLKRGSIAVQKFYPADKPYLEPRRVSFELSHSDIIGNRGAEIIAMAF